MKSMLEITLMILLAVGNVICLNWNLENDNIPLAVMNMVSIIMILFLLNNNDDSKKGM